MTEQAFVRDGMSGAGEVLAVLEGHVVADAVVHPYNLAPKNRNPRATEQLDAVYAAHVMATGENPEHVLTREEFFTDFSFDAMARSLFVESATDFAVLHALPNLGFANSFVTAPERAAAYRDLHPGRFAFYATIDTHVVADAIRDLEFQVREFGVDGLKLYPAFFYDDLAEGWRLDGSDFATPVLEAARELGIRNVAVHKTLWLPPAPKEAFDLDDVSGALDRFADLNFFLVHAGAAFIDRTAELLRRHPNLHATMETTFAYLVVRPEVFASVLARFLGACGSSRLLYGSGSNLSHPDLLLRAFENYELPPEALEKYGCPQVTAPDRAAILGGNALRLHGRTSEGVLADTAGDAFETERAAGGAPPWSGVRSPAASGATA
ncbi:amidohydrolase family protein [Sporichthya sp.]|uniref:amidohydrolase family protein n=1 Tax=Sporichthya sp. TaxID=65475 RepID=UPI0017A9FE4D|nr:amidohydrolase family protein [Sporichthya sp.]MBA3744348.1 amidohydrolase family protein [Sporichthya sp.]